MNKYTVPCRRILSRRFSVEEVTDLVVEAQSPEDALALVEKAFQELGEGIIDWDELDEDVVGEDTVELEVQEPSPYEGGDKADLTWEDLSGH